MGPTRDKLFQVQIRWHDLTVKQGLIFTSCLRNHWYDSDFVTSIKWKRSMNIVCNIGWKYGSKIKRCYKNYCTCVVILCHTTEVFGITAVSIIRLDCLLEGRRLGDTYNVFISTVQCQRKIWPKTDRSIWIIQAQK